MSFSELGRMIELLGKDRGIERDVVINAIEQAFLVTARKKFGIQGDYETRYNEDDDEIEIYQYKNVVDEVGDSILEINLIMAKDLDEKVEVGDQIGVKIENPSFTRVDVQTAKQIIFQKVRDAEREILFAEFKHRENELITGIARRYERGNIVVDLGKAEAILPRREIIPGENFSPGDRLQAYLTEVVMTNRGPEIRLSRTSPLFLVKLFEIEVPEIQDGTITIKSAAREPGQRAKVAVISDDRDIDPVGACVGLKGSRVQNIVNELQGEKIDIVKWSDDIDVFAKSALAPAEITNIMVDSENVSMDVVVDEDQLALAIGRRGQNVRLAAMLTGHKVNIISKTKLQNKINKAVALIMLVEGLNESMAQVLVQEGIMSLEDIIELETTELQDILKFEEAEIVKIKERTVTVIEKIAKEALAAEEAAVDGDESENDKEGSKQIEEEDEELISATAVPAYNGILFNDDGENEEEQKAKFLEAEKRLREELASFKIK